METAILVALGWMCSLCLHEFSHAIVAYWGGDTDVKDKGYLTFNIFKYTDPFTTLLIPAVILALGGIAFPGAAVYINVGNLRSIYWWSAVSIAGPIGSAISACITAAPLILLPPISGEPDWIRPALAYLTGLIVFSVYFNLIPFPPFDGYGVIQPFLPRPARKVLNAVAPAGLWIVVALLLFVPGLAESMFHYSKHIIAHFGISQRLYEQGERAFEQHTSVLAVIIFGIMIVSARTKGKRDDSQK